MGLRASSPQPVADHFWSAPLTEQAVPEKLERAEWGTAPPFGVELDRRVEAPPGTFDHDAQRRAVQEAARCIAQVLDVTNDLGGTAWMSWKA